ncbi:hypothetical protein PL2TA16_02591, partial [Pseudoalteromonas luteoviolacea 2ta16]
SPCAKEPCLLDLQSLSLALWTLKQVQGDEEGNAVTVNTRHCGLAPQSMFIDAVLVLEVTASAAVKLAHFTLRKVNELAALADINTLHLLHLAQKNRTHCVRSRCLLHLIHLCKTMYSQRIHWF